MNFDEVDGGRIGHARRQRPPAGVARRRCLIDQRSGNEQSTRLTIDAPQRRRNRPNDSCRRRLGLGTGTGRRCGLRQLGHVLSGLLSNRTPVTGLPPFALQLGREVTSAVVVDRQCEVQVNSGVYQLEIFRNTSTSRQKSQRPTSAGLVGLRSCVFRRCA